MNSETHTPGPWAIKHDRNNRTRVVMAEREYVGIATVNASIHITGNAALIAAAPDMLAALKEAFETLTSRDACDLAPIVGSDNPHENAAGLVQAAIARAEGKAS